MITLSSAKIINVNSSRIYDKLKKKTEQVYHLDSLPDINDMIKNRYSQLLKIDLKIDSFEIPNESYSKLKIDIAKTRDKLYSDILTKLTKVKTFYDKMHINLTNQEWFGSYYHVTGTAINNIIDLYIPFDETKMPLLYISKVRILIPTNDSMNTGVNVDSLVRAYQSSYLELYCKYPILMMGNYLSNSEYKHLYTELSKIEPSPNFPVWSPGDHFFSKFVKPIIEKINVTISKISDLDLQFMDRFSQIIICIGYLNSANESCYSSDESKKSYGRNGLTDGYYENTLYILIDPGDSMYSLINQEIPDSSHICYCKCMPLCPTNTKDYDDYIYYVNLYLFNDNSLEAVNREIMKDVTHLGNLFRMYGDKIMVYDSMWFYGNPVLTCPFWFRDAIKTINNYGDRYIGYECKAGILTTSQKCIDPLLPP